jgi:hypothetical protein
LFTANLKAFSERVVAKKEVEEEVVEDVKEESEDGQTEVVRVVKTERAI